MKIEIKNENLQVVQVIHLEQGEYKMFVSQTETSMQKTVAKSIHEHFRDARVTIILLSLLCSYVLLEVVFINKSMYDFWGLLQMLLVRGSYILTGAVVGSIIVKIVTARNKPWCATNVSIMGSIMFELKRNNILGMRWALPEVFWIDEVYSLLWLVLVGLGLWWVIGILFERMAVGIRLGIISVIGLCTIGYQLINYLPVKDTYSYLYVETSPPRFQFLESKAISLDEFLTEIDGVK